jgi:glucose/arabinose dehydrogenase
MTRTRLTALALAIVIAAGVTSDGAFAQNDAAPAAAPDAAPAAGEATPAKQKPKPKAKPTVAVVVTNHRSVGLKELSAAAAGGPKSKKIVTDLKSGAKKTVRLGKGKDCLYDFHATYDDGASADLTSVDICKDQTIDLVE